MDMEEKIALREEGMVINRELRPEPCFKWRYLVAILGSMGMAIIYGLKVNLHFAIVSMVNHTAVAAMNNDSHHGGGHGDSHGGGHDNISAAAGEEKAETLLDGPFVWSTQEQGLILSSYFVGYFVTQIPGGRMAEIFSGKWVFLVAVLMNTVGTLLTPCLAFLDLKALIAIRVFEGFGGGFTFPAMNVLVAAWSPPTERSTIGSIAFSGASLGTVLSMMSSGVIMTTISWEAVFYIQGTLSLFWCLMWAVLVSDSPSTSRFAKQEEKEYIESSQPKQTPGKKPSVPWLSMLTSVPFITLSVSHFCNNFGWYMLLVELPLFARSGLKVDMTVNTIMSSVPFFANWIFSVVFSKTLDTARAKGWLSTTMARKVSVGFASLLPALCLLGIIFAGDQVAVVVVLTTLAVMFYASMFSGVFSNQADLAPNFAGTLMAVTNMVATIPGFLVPVVVGYLTHGADGLAPWHLVFGMTIGVLIFEFVIFAIFGKGEIQAWNEGK